LSFDLSHSFTLMDDPGISLDLGAHLGYNSKLFIRGEGTDVLLSAGVTVPLTGSLYMTPKVAYSMPFGDLEDEDDGNYDEYFYSGVSLAFTF